MIALGAGSPTDIRRFGKEMRAPFPLLPDPKIAVFRRFRVDTVPRNFLLTPKGVKAADVTGFSPTEFRREIVAPMRRMLR